MPEELNEDPRSDSDLDALADSTNAARNSERPMKDEAPAPGAVPAKTAAEEKWEFDHGGKKISGNREQMIKWAQMGYDRPQFMQKFNQEKSTWEQQRQAREAQFKQYEEKFKPYLEIDEWASKNPDQWQRIQQQWQQSQTGAPGATPAQGSDPRYDAIQSKLQYFEQVVPKFEKLATEIAEQRALEEQKRADETLDGEIQSIRAQHKDLDWDTLDADGKSLEIRVMEHAQKEDIKSFRAAMRDLLHDDLVSRASSQGKIAVSKGIQQKSKLGILGESSMPKLQGTPRPENRNMRTTSYEDLERDVKEEIRSGRIGA